MPTYRPDCEREIDLIEEVARHHGYNNVARTLPRMEEPSGGRRRSSGGGGRCATPCSAPACPRPTRSRWWRRPISPPPAFRPRASSWRTRCGPRSRCCARRCCPGCCGRRRFNAGHGLPDVGLFEIGHVFLPPPAGQTLPDEREHLAVVLTGAVFRLPHEPNRPVDGHDAVGALETVAEALGLADWSLKPDDAPGFGRGRAAAVVVDGDVVGAVGEIDAAVRTRLGLAGPVAALEVNLSRVLDATRKERRSVTPSRYPASAIDLAFVLDDAVPAGAAQRTLAAAAGDLLEDIRLFDVFRSDALGPGRKSLAFGLRFRAPDRTLTDEDVGALRQRCIDAMAKQHGASLRG